MTIEGPWIVGAFDDDFPDVNWQAAELPEGPARQGHADVLQLLGRRRRRRHRGGRRAGRATSPHPRSSRRSPRRSASIRPRPSLEEWNAEAQPEKAAFNAGIDYAQGQVALPGFASVIADLNAQLEALGSGARHPR